MFRKPKKRVPKGMRRKKSDDSDDETANAATAGAVQQQDTAEGAEEEGEESTSALLSEARKRTKLAGGKFSTAPGNTNSSSGGTSGNTRSNSNNKKTVMHQYATSTTDARKRNADLVTSTVQHHPTNQLEQHQPGEAAVGNDGIFRDKTRSKLLAGPLKVTTSIRTTARFDYQPDICKDYKETGFCGFGDTCIYLHDRGDTLTGWQLEKQWEEEQKRKKEKQERDIQGFVDGTGNAGGGADADGKQAALTTDDGLPYACHLCRNHFTNPVVTSCGHFFCEACIMNRVRTESSTCPICAKDTHGVFNQPTKLINKKRKVLGAAAAKQDNSWEAFAKAFSSAAGENDTTDE